MLARHTAKFLETITNFGQSHKQHTWATSDMKPITGHEHISVAALVLVLIPLHTPALAGKEGKCFKEADRHISSYSSQAVLGNNGWNIGTMHGSDLAFWKDTVLEVASGPILEGSGGRASGSCGHPFLLKNKPYKAPSERLHTAFCYVLSKSLFVVDFEALITLLCNGVWSNLFMAWDWTEQGERQ